MPRQRIIRNDATLDRPIERVTTDEVFEIAKTMPSSFSTCDIADRIVLVGNHRGMSYERIERAVRAAVARLVSREVAYIDGEQQKITGAGFRSRPFNYCLYLGRTWDKTKREAVRSGADFALLYRAFC